MTPQEIDKAIWEGMERSVLRWKKVAVTCLHAVLAKREDGYYCQSCSEKVEVNDA